jgi:hypothetical protein
VPSTYSNLKIQLMATGENSGTWGNVTNDNLGVAIEQALVETATVTFSSANVTLTLTDTNAAQNARALRLNLTGTTGGARDLIVPAIQKPYIVNNGTADTVTIKVSGQTGVAVPASKTILVYNNGTDVVDAINHLSALSLGTALPITSGGTGSTSTTYANLQSNVTGTLPAANGGTGVTSLGTGVATALGQAVTGSGGIALGTSPTFTTPVLGTPTSGTLSNCTVDGTDAVGFRNVPQNSQSAAYTLVLSDAGKHIFHPAADNNARTFTIPANSSVAYPIGTAITFINMAAANVTIAITSDTLTLSAAGTTGSRTLATNGSATCIKIASTQWLISGSGLT